MIIDFHTHCFPDALAARALGVLQHNAEKIQMTPCTDGTQSGTERHIAASGVDYAVVCNIATNARQQVKVNDFAISLIQNSKTLLPLGSLHPDGENKKSELERLYNAGICGIKIHPDYITIQISDAKYDEIFSLCEEMGMFVVTHAGWDPVSPNHVHATPDDILKVITRHPKLKLVAAHMGGYEYSQEVLEKLVGQNIYFDTSLSAHRVNERENLLRILREHRPDRLLFATDTPWSLAAKELEFISSANLSDELKENILYRNALELLGKK
ncbi:MAG: amidohydrolase family protein [Clostridia bacterium]|nr:amidohydrolase family protein [Clostridia bacterium]